MGKPGTYYTFKFEGCKGETQSQATTCDAHLSCLSWWLILHPKDAPVQVQFYCCGKAMLLAEPFTGDLTPAPWTAAMLEQRGRHLYGPIEYFRCKPGDEIRVEVYFDDGCTFYLALGGQLMQMAKQK